MKRKECAGYSSKLMHLSCSPGLPSIQLDSQSQVSPGEAIRALAPKVKSPCSLTDFLPTCLKLSGLSIATEIPQFSLQFVSLQNWAHPSAWGGGGVRRGTDRDSGEDDGGIHDFHGEVHLWEVFISTSTRWNEDRKEWSRKAYLVRKNWSFRCQRSPWMVDLSFKIVGNSLGSGLLVWREEKRRRKSVGKKGSYIDQHPGIHSLLTPWNCLKTGHLTKGNPWE